jgi:hypothetical protein
VLLRSFSQATTGFMRPANPHSPYMPENGVYCTWNDSRLIKTGMDNKWEQK